MIKIDDITIDQAKGKYIRIYVEVNLNEALLSELSIKGKIYCIEYKCIHMLCFHYGKYGHYVEGYSKKLVDTTEAGVENDFDKSKEDGGIIALKEDFMYGKLILVQKSRKLKK